MRFPHRDDDAAKTLRVAVEFVEVGRTGVVADVAVAVAF